MSQFKEQVLNVLEDVCENDIVKRTQMCNYSKKEF